MEANSGRRHSLWHITAATWDMGAWPTHTKPTADHHHHRPHTHAKMHSGITHRAWRMAAATSTPRPRTITWAAGVGCTHLLANGQPCCLPTEQSKQLAKHDAPPKKLLQVRAPQVGLHLGQPTAVREGRDQVPDADRHEGEHNHPARPHRKVQDLALGGALHEPCTHNLLRHTASDADPSASRGSTLGVGVMGERGRHWPTTLAHPQPMAPHPDHAPWVCLLLLGP